MAASCIRKQLFGFRRAQIIIRNIMTTPSKAQKALENLQKNPYYEKYADRIASLQKTSPDEFLQRVEEQEKARQEERKKKFGFVDTRQYSSVLNPKESLSGSVTVEDKKLEAIFKVELVKDKDTAEIQAIWEEYHKHKDVICATIPSDKYAQINSNMQKYPTFLFPLPREQGYEFFLCQSAGHALHFTPLLAYQVHKENAPECLTVAHYPELAERGLVLMRGDYDKKVLSGKEAACLANQFQLYYGCEEGERARLLRAFSEEPAAFRHMELVRQLEQIPLH